MPVDSQELDSAPEKSRPSQAPSKREPEPPLSLNIRGKIVLPFLILTLVVAVIGTYVVTSLVASSLDERLTNQLLESGRVVSDTLARQEIAHLESARTIAFTEGLDEALKASDQEATAALAQPVAVVRGIESLLLLDAEGREIVHLLKLRNGALRVVEGPFDASKLWMVQDLLKAADPNARPRRGIVLHQFDQRRYYFTAIPVVSEGEAIGVIIVGTSLDTLLPYLKTTSLADVTIYQNDGQAVKSTFTLAEQPSEVDALLDELSISPDLHEEILQGEDSTIGKNVSVRERRYRLAYAPLRIGNDILGVFSVALPTNFIVRAGATSRNTYALIFTAAMAGVILLGYIISQRITQPIARLVHTSQAVAEGDLNQRTGILRTDEIGKLAVTFDEMTNRLAERTRALEETLGRMQAILSSIGDGVVLENPEGDLITLNAAAESLLQEMEENFKLGPLRELPSESPDTDLDLHPDAWPQERRRFEVGDKMISTNSAAVRTEEGKYLGQVLVLRDVTAEVEAERLKAAFITHVSHELRTPLTAIKGYSELLVASASEALNEDQRRFLKTITRHTDRLIVMIDALLDFSEVEAWGRLGVRQRPIDLSSIIEEVSEEWQPRMAEKELTFEVKIPDGPNIMVNADAKRLRYAINSLVRNAWQHTSDGDNVTIQLGKNESQVTLTIIDTGRSISPEEEKELFSPFGRTARPVPEPGEETRDLGIGLYVTKVIVEAHGGEIHFDSEKGLGSTFDIVLPVLQDQGGSQVEAEAL